MDSRTARWAQIVWLYPDQVTDLHQHELWLGTRSGPLNEPRFIQKGLPTWQAKEMISRGILSVFPDGYWPRGMDSSEQANSLEIFEREIFPIWMGILQKAVEADKKLTHEQVNSPGQVMFEVLTTHKQDIAIITSGNKPNRMGHDQEKMTELRQKAARASR